VQSAAYGLPVPFAEQSLGEFAAAVGEPSPTPASGSVTAVTAALAAGLAELTARVSGSESVEDAVRLRERLLSLADEDAAAYSDFMVERSDAARERTIDVPLEIAEQAARVGELADELRRAARGSVAGDAEVAGVIARSAVAAAVRLVELNLAGKDDPRAERARRLLA
jgi:formiminotetrahydrofolate cyclodeaminase